MDKCILGRLTAAVAGLAGLWLAGAASAENVVQVTQVSYDAVGRPICTAVRTNPGAFGSLPESACSLGSQGAHGPDRITKTVYDAAGQVVQVRQAVATSVERVYSTFSYSPNGKVTDSIDANGNRTRMTYDGFDRLSGLYYPSTARPPAFNPSTQATALATAGAYSNTDYEAYGYDDNGNRTWWRRRDNNYIYYNYDNLNREILHYNPGGLIPHLYTTYDLTGKVLKKRFNDWNGPGVTYTYDGLGRVQTATDINNRTLTYGYNQASARNGMVFPDGKNQHYDYDVLNRLKYTDISGSGVATNWTYNDKGRIENQTRWNNTWTGFGYDGISRLTALHHYFPDNTKDASWAFDYNPASQITALGSYGSDQYDFRETQSNTDNRAFDGLNRDAGIAALGGGYDARGNLTKDGARSMVYDLYNRLATLSGNGQNLQLSYDPEGRLASYTANGAVTQFLYDGTDLIAEYNGAGQMQKRYLHGIGTDDPWVELNGADVNSGTARYLYANYQGSIMAVANGSGSLTDVYKYGPYGEPKNADNQTSFSGSRFRYTGQTVLPEAQLYYYKARVYDPMVGRFLQTDPIGSDDDLNLYAYTGGDPINATDPTGEVAVTCTYTEEDKTARCQASDDGAKDLTLTTTYVDKNGNGNSVTKTYGASYVSRVGRFTSIANAQFKYDNRYNVVLGNKFNSIIRRSVDFGNFGFPGLPGNGPNSRGSTGRQPQNLKEQEAMREAQSNPAAGQPGGTKPLGDARWPASDGWVKMRQNVNGVEVHYNYNTRTGQTDDWKIK